MNTKLNNINVLEEQVLITPANLKIAIPLSEEARLNVLSYRRQVGNSM